MFRGSHFLLDTVCVSGADLGGEFRGFNPLKLMLYNKTLRMWSGNSFFYIQYNLYSFEFLVYVPYIPAYKPTPIPAAANLAKVTCM